MVEYSLPGLLLTHLTQAAKEASDDEEEDEVEEKPKRKRAAPKKSAKAAAKVRLLCGFSAGCRRT
jgi:uncharacterized protein (DUF4415 family)